MKRSQRDAAEVKESTLMQDGLEPEESDCLQGLPADGESQTDGAGEAELQEVPAEESEVLAPAQPASPQKTTAQLLRNLALKLALIVLAVWLGLTFVLSITVHYGINMHPAIKDGDFVTALRLQDPYLEAAVVYNHDGKKCVGRVVALGGADVDINEIGEIKVNGVIPSEEVFYPTYASEGSRVTFPYHVEEGKAFILNDFRTDTNDSRSFGAVDVEDIDGPLIFCMRRRGF